MRGCAVRGTERRREEGRHIYLNEHGWWKLVLAGAGYLAHPNPSIRLSHGVTLEAVDPVTHTHTLRHRRHVCQKPSHRKSRLPSESQMTFQVSHIGFPSIPPLHNHHKYHITHIFLQRLFCFFSQHLSEFQRNIIPHVSSHTCYPTLERQCPLASSEAPA